LPLNLLGFATNRVLLSPSEVLAFPSSIASFAYLRELVTQFSIPPIIGYLFKLALFIYLIKSLLIIHKYKVNFDDLVIFTIIFITNYSISTGGYGMLYYIPALVLLYKQKNFAILILIVTSMYIGIWDLVSIFKYNGGEMIPYLSEKTVIVEPFISLGSIIRPIANFAALVLFFKNLEKRYTHETIKN
jgi:hypothetical protein